MPNPAIRIPVAAHDELARLADTLEITLGQAHRIALTAGLPELRRRATAYQAHVVVHAERVKL